MLPAAAAELPVVSVTLSNAGVAQIERRGPVAAGEPVVLRAPLEDVDDLLKSLVVLDPRGTVEGVRLPAQDVAAEAFRGLPLRPADFETRVSLLQALRGQMVEAGGFTGHLADAAEAEEGLRLALVTDAGIATAMVREGEEVRLLDAALSARIRRAADALAATRSEDERRIEIDLGSDQTRDVSLLSVTGAPLWKPSWRLLVPEGEGKARLLGWAVIENRSGADWDGVRLALVSGNPAAYRQALYAPVEVRRQMIPVRAAGTVTVTPDTGPRPAAPLPPMAMAAPPMPAPARETVGATARMAREIATQAQAVAQTSIGRVAFVLPAPVTVRSGETANVPFIDAQIPAERLWWVQDTGARNPLLAVRITNDTGASLPDGIVTVYGAAGAEEGAFLGDSEMRAVAAGEPRILAFGRDRDVQMTRTSSVSERPTAIALQRGAIIVTAQQRNETALAIDPSGAHGKLIVDIPRDGQAKPDFSVIAEGDFGFRHEVMLEGKPVTLRLGLEHEVDRIMPLWDSGLRSLSMLPDWRNLDLEATAPRLPGGPGTLERLRDLLAKLPPETKGRAILASVVDEMAAIRVKLDAARAAIGAWAVANAALDRARQAVEDRSGAQKEDARRRLNEASVAVERAGAAADAAWTAWREAAARLLAREAQP